MARFRKGDYKVRCDRSGAIVNASRCRKMWNGLFVLRELWEPRHPQDFAPNLRLEPVPANPRPWGTDVFIGDENSMTWGDGTEITWGDGTGVEWDGEV